jgi:hypothetical protein
MMCYILSIGKILIYYFAQSEQDKNRLVNIFLKIPVMPGSLFSR